MSDDPMGDLLSDSVETTDQEGKRQMAASKKYKKAKPGDPGVQSFELSDDPATDEARRKAKALREVQEEP
jgi:hypothetical protein